MPLLGYAGYLPFGLECAAVRDLLEDLLRPIGRSRITADRPAPVRSRQEVDL